MAPRNPRVESERDIRASLAKSRRVIIKLGSRILAQPDGEGAKLIDSVARSVQRFLDGGRKKAARRGALVVSSGAIALGVQKLKLPRRPKEMALLQAAGAAGQSRLMHRYEQAFKACGLDVAQVLLTHADLANRNRANNARDALSALLDAGLVPVVNENDVVSVDEIRFGDNDQLASMVAPLIDADLLILLSDVPGVLNEKGRRVSLLRRAADAPNVWTKKSSNAVGSGGMSSKIIAAQNATVGGTHTVIAGVAEEDVIDRILRGESVGTLMPARSKRLAARKHWIAYTLRPKGAVVLDNGAVEAVTRGRHSLLAVGLRGVRGSFRAGDAVSVERLDGIELGRGLSRLSATDAASLAGIRGPEESPLVIHRDDLVIFADR